MLSPRTRKVLFASLPLFTTLASAAQVAPPTAAELRKLQGVRWFGVYIGPAKCGYARETFNRVEKNGTITYVVASDVMLKIQMLGTIQEIEIKDSRTFSEDGKFLSFQGGMTSTAASQNWEASVEGDRMRVISKIAGCESAKTIPAPKMTLGDLLGGNLLVLRGARTGTKADGHLYDATIGKELATVVKIGRKKDIMFNGVQTEVVAVSSLIPEINITSTSWVSSEGISLETEQSVGLMKMRMRLEDEKLAKDIAYSRDLVNESVIKTDKSIPDAVKCKRLKLRIANVESDKIILPSGRMIYNKLTDGSYELACAIERVDLAKALRLPITAPEMKEYLASEELVQSDAPEIVKTAKEIVGAETNSWRAACKINQWVHKSLAKVGTATFSNALDTLRTRKGDCSEHSVLAAALCRAAGIPARQCAGLAYWTPQGGFAGHQWTEVWVGQWVAMDPAFGQDIADATHLKFVEGTLRDAIGVYGFFSKLKIEVVESD